MRADAVPLGAQLCAAGRIGDAVAGAEQTCRIAIQRNQPVLLSQRPPVILYLDALQHILLRLICHICGIIKAFVVHAQQTDQRIAGHDIEVDIGQRLHVIKRLCGTDQRLADRL